MLSKSAPGQQIIQDFDAHAPEQEIVPAEHVVPVPVSRAGCLQTVAACPPRCCVFCSVEEERDLSLSVWPRRPKFCQAIAALHVGDEACQRRAASPRF
jgi:hypothetical protein